MKPVTLVCVSYRRFDLLGRMLASCETGSRRPDRYVLVSNGGDLERAITDGRVTVPSGLAPERVTVKDLGRVSVAAAWNHAHRLVDGYSVVAGDDVALGHGTIEQLARAANEAGALFAYHASMDMFGVHLLERGLFDRVGWYDEQFFPAYFEDNDMAWRMKLAGVTPLAVSCDPCGGDVSATLQSFSPAEMEEHHTQFRDNQRRYMTKWGGLPSHEIYVTPRS